MNKLFYFCFLIIAFSMEVVAQNTGYSQRDDPYYCNYKLKLLNITYPNDTLPITPGWRCDSNISDEFEGTTINTSKWTIPDLKYYHETHHIGYVNSPRLIWIENGQLMLKVLPNSNSVVCHNTHGGNDNPEIPPYLTGSIISKNEIRYGYIETECYLPKNHHYWPCFWTIGSVDSDYSEVDVFERTSNNNTDFPNVIRQNCYTNAPNLPGDGNNSQTTQILTFSDSITGKTSVFGVEILPKEVVFYINGHVTSHLKYCDNLAMINNWNSYTCTNIEEMMKTEVRLTMNCYPGTTSLPQPNEPARFSYFKYYRLERGDTDTYHPTVFTPSNESTKVYPHIILGGTGCTANITTPTAIWAEQDIVFDKGFEVSAGTSFSARVIQVPNPESSPLYKQNSYY